LRIKEQETHLIIPEHDDDDDDDEVRIIIFSTSKALLCSHLRLCLADLVRDACAEAGLLLPVLLPHLNNNNNDVF